LKKDIKKLFKFDSMFFLKHLSGIFSFFSQLQWTPIAQSKRIKNLLTHVHNKIHQSNLNSFYMVWTEGIFFVYLQTEL